MTQAPATHAEAVDRYTAAGYTADFKAEPDGLRDQRTCLLYAPESLVVDDQARFEGITNPDDQSIVFALRSADGAVRGTYSTAFGPVMDAVDAEIVSRLGSAPKDGVRPGPP